MGVSVGMYVGFLEGEDGIREAEECRGLGDVYRRRGRTRILRNSCR